MQTPKLRDSKKLSRHELYPLNEIPPVIEKLSILDAIGFDASWVEIL